MSHDRTFFVAGTLLAGTAVAAGAFGTHGLQGRLAPPLLQAFETGARVQMLHAVALLAVAWGCTRWPTARVASGGWLLVAGTILFSGSLYGMALTGVRTFGAVTPVGGVLLLVGWSLLAVGVARCRETPPDEPRPET
jgi:uncharacterized membrane protein YgdD (TMEM256/DUF423 family)